MTDNGAVIAAMIIAIGLILGGVASKPRIDIDLGIHQALALKQGLEQLGCNASPNKIWRTNWCELIDKDE